MPNQSVKASYATAQQKSKKYVIKQLKTLTVFLVHTDYKILIEGEPGIGKTILSYEIAAQWANKSLLDDKALLLFLLFM